jgi:hypothetical protein
MQGRIDKKFCSDYCRNKYHNRLHARENNYIRKVNYILRKNRRILLELMQSGIETIPPTNLAQAGFNFKFFTSIQKNPHGQNCYFCYELGYLKRRDGEWTLIQKNIDQKVTYLFIDNISL